MHLKCPFTVLQMPALPAELLLQLLVTENTYCWGSKRQVHQCVGIGFQVIPGVEGLHNFGAVAVLRETRDLPLNGLTIHMNKI